MKDLILITAYCPDTTKEEILRELISNLYNFKDEFDLGIVSHTPIPLDIQSKVNFSLYDSKNEILTEPDLLNKPWIGIGEAPYRMIRSSYLTGINTHLAIWRMWILGFSLAKNIGYKKIHTIEYDALVKNIDELKDNSNLLDTYKSIYYLESKKDTRPILFGSTQSYNVDYIHPILLNLDEENIKNMIRKSHMSPEEMLQDLIHKMGDYLVKDRDVLETNNNTFAKSNKIEPFNPWGVPFYDYLEDSVKFVTFNTLKENGVSNQIIVNNKKLYTISNIPINGWSVVKLGELKDIYYITIMEDDKIRLKLDLSTEVEKKKFIEMSYQDKTAS